MVLAASLTPVSSPASFALTPAVNPWTVQQNAGAMQNIAVTPINGFSCPTAVALSVSGVPSGVTTAFPVAR